MCRNPLLRSVLAAVLVLGLLLPAAAAARGPVLNSTPSAGWEMLPGGLWDLFLQFLGKAPHLKNRGTIDPDGATVVPTTPANDNRGTIDPNG
jgi:hypothetical protein